MLNIALKGIIKKFSKFRQQIVYILGKQLECIKYSDISKIPGT